MPLCTLSTVRHRVEDGPDPEDPVHDLIEAIRAQDLKRVKVLLARGGLHAPATPKPEPRDALLWLLTHTTPRATFSVDAVVREAFAQGHAGALAAVLEHQAMPSPLPWMGSLDVWALVQAQGERLDAAGMLRQLHGSVRRGRLDLVRHWVGQGASLDAMDEQGRTAAHLLADPDGAFSDAVTLGLDGRLAMLDLLLELGASLERADQHGETVLLRTLGHVNDPLRAFPDFTQDDPGAMGWALALEMLARGANACATGPQGSALLKAFSHAGWRSGVVTALVERGGRPRTPAPGPKAQKVAGAWTRAIRSQSMDLVELCLVLNEPVNGTEGLPSTPGSEHRPLTPLVLAASQGFGEAVDRLIDAGADLDAAVRHPFWTVPDRSTNLCQEILLPTPDYSNGNVRPDQVMQTGQRLLERALLRQAANQEQALTEGGDSQNPRPVGACTAPVRRRL